jgi:hypothetical protein
MLMNRVMLRAALVLSLAALATAQQAPATLPHPKLASILPAGAKAGTSVEVRLTGLDLDQTDRLLFSHPGITAQSVQLPPDRVYPQGRRVPNSFKISVAGDVPAGTYEVRAAGYFGLSNGRRFAVGTQDERMEKEPNNTPDQAEELAPDTVVNGLTDPQNYDYFRIGAKKGQRYIVDCAALRIDSRAQVVLTLLDAQGAESQSSRATKDRDPMLDFIAAEDGPVLLRVNDLTFKGGDEYPYRLVASTGPWIDFADPPFLKAGVDNEVWLYGRNLPGGSPADDVKLDGRPIEKLKVMIKAPSDPSTAVIATDTLLRPGDTSTDLVTYRLEGRSNPIRLMLMEDTPVREVEPNDTPEQAQLVTPPVQIVGRFQQPGDRDGYAFEAKKGDKLWIEVFSARLGVPDDPSLVIQSMATDDKGHVTVKDIVEADDQPSPIPPMANAMEKRYRAGAEDPAILFTVPADGKYRVMIRDLYSSAQGDPRFYYRLEIRAPKPDFRLIAFPVEAFPTDGKHNPSTCTVRRGGAERLRIIAYRREGFDGAIRIEPEGLPPGVTAHPTLISPGDTAADVVLQAAADAPSYAGQLKLNAKSELEGKTVSRPVRGAEVLFAVADMQKDPFVTRVTDGIALAVDEKFVSPVSLQVSDGPFRMVRGGKLKLPVKLVKNADAKDLDKAKFKLVPVDMPGGRKNDKSLAAKDLTLDLAKPEGELEIDVTERAPLGVFTMYVTSDVDVNWIRTPDRLKKAQEEQKRLDQVGPEVAAEAKTAAEGLKKADTELAAATQEVAKAKASGAQEAVLKTAEDHQRTAEEARAKASEADKKAQEAAKTLDAAKKELPNEIKVATEAVKEKKIKAWVASLAVPIEIVSCPVSLKTAAEGVTIKPGETAEASVDLLREFGFAGDVKLDLVPGNAPVKLAGPVTAPAAQAQAKLAIAADKAAKAGAYTATIRGTLTFNAKTVTVDIPLPVTIAAAAP